MRYFTKSLCLTFNKDIMENIMENIMKYTNNNNNNMNMTKARLYKVLKTNNQTRKATRDKTIIKVKNKKKVLHTNSIKHHNKQFNLRRNTIKNFNT
jgi:hypothetical protein